jgi:hypothetical protein
MNICANHAEKPAIAYCRSCGKALCEVCRIEEYGAAYCAEHAPAAHPASGASTPPPPPHQTGYAPPAPYVNSPYTAPIRPSGPSVALAVFLGMIPGVGAIYNGQYAKGLIHAVVFGLMITIASNDPGPAGPLIGILIAVWWFYMVLEAYHTARKKRDGLPVDEFSSIVNLRGTQVGLPLGAIVLIGVGILLLLNSTGLVPMERVIRYWPAGLILLGVYMLYAREHRPLPTVIHPAVQELTDERQ